jgi:hypothetical protein
MMAFPSMLVRAAEEARMKVPDDPNDFNAEEFPHFQCFCSLQLCRPITWGEHWENAKVIAGFTEDEIKAATLETFIERGLQFQ